MRLNILQNVSVLSVTHDAIGRGWVISDRIHEKIMEFGKKLGQIDKKLAEFGMKLGQIDKKLGGFGKKLGEFGERVVEFGVKSYEIRVRDLYEGKD
jgi:hypothetical protein